MHLNEINLLNKLQEIFGVGTVRKDKNSVHYQVTGLKIFCGAEIIIEHFKNFPLQSSKKNSFLFL